jgi:hypothetical protein
MAERREARQIASGARAAAGLVLLEDNNVTAPQTTVSQRERFFGRWGRLAFCCCCCTVVDVGGECGTIVANDVVSAPSEPRPLLALFCSRGARRERFAAGCCSVTLWPIWLWRAG